MVTITAIDPLLPTCGTPIRWRFAAFHALYHLIYPLSQLPSPPGVRAIAIHTDGLGALRSDFDQQMSPK